MIAELTEGQRQLMLMAIGRLAADRPGFDAALEEIAGQLKHGDHEGAACGIDLFSKFRQMRREDIAACVD